MKRQRKVLFIAPLVTLALLGMAYLYLAFAPTSYGRIEKRHADALRRADTILSSPDTPAEIPSEEKEQGPPPTDFARETPHPEAQSVPGEVDFLIELREICCQWLKTVNREFRESVDSSLGGIEGLRGWPDSLWLLPTEFESTSETLVAEVLPSAVQGIHDVALKTVRDHRAARESRVAKTAALAQKTRNVEEDMPDLAEENIRRETLHSVLDRLERFLLRDSWKTPNFDDGLPFYENIPDVFSRLALMAIVRATLLGESQNAADLLEKYLEAQRILHFWQFPIPRWSTSKRPLEHAQSVLFVVGELESFPDEGFARADAVLRKVPLGQERFKDLQKAYALRFRTLAQARMVWRAWGATRRQEGGEWWEQLIRIRRRAVDSASEPILMREVDQLLAAVADDDSREINVSLARIAALAEVLGALGVSEAGPMSRDLRYFVSSMEKLRYPEEVRFARLILASVRYRRDHGEYPRVTGDLVPDYLDPTFADSSERAWRVLSFGEGLWVPAFLVSRDGYGRRSNFTYLAVSRFVRMHQRLPATLDELRRDIPDAKIDAHSLQEFQGRPLFCRFVRHGARRHPLNVWRRQRTQFGLLTPEEKEEIRRLEAAGESKVERMVRVSVRCPVYPLITDELTDLLEVSDRENDGEEGRPTP